ncbi:MAG: glycosyltransferase family 2 protein [Clostridia bacterium]|nr:glycosyltransferase family 2 protein [Clostridia bacterium]
MSLSVCLIVKDEEEVISRCLTCVKKFANEIVVVDTGSSDGTVNKVKKFTDKIYFFKWVDDFSAARNFAMEKATCDFVMWLDADDVVTDENCIKIKNLVDGADFDMAFLPYAAAYEGDAPTFVYYRERIFRRSENFRFSGAVHEAVTPQGKIIYSDATVSHKKVKPNAPLRNLHLLQKRIARGICLNEREKFYYGRELLFNGMFRESIAVLEDFLSGNGWVENKIEACLNLCRAYSEIGDKNGSLNALLRSFLYAPPRSEACCVLGAYFFEQNCVSCAIYWYELALKADNDAKGGGFVNLDFSGFIPYIQLCVLYDRLGDFEKANFYNEKAGEIKPNDKSYLSNKLYFQAKLNKEVK